MTLKKVLSFLLSVLLLITTFAACDYNEDFTLYFELNEEPATLDPQLVSSCSEEILIRNMFEGLCRLDTEGNVVLGAAQQYELSSDGLTYTFTLREDALWSNGEPVTAADFVLGFKRGVDPATKSPKASLLSQIKGAEEIIAGNGNGEFGVVALDDKTLKITLTEKKPDFLTTLTSSVCMPCHTQTFNKSKGKYGLNKDDILCNGSFTLKKWEKEETFTLKLSKNPNYKGEFESKTAGVIFSAGEISGRAARIKELNLDFGFIDLSEAEEENKKFTFSRTEYALIMNKSDTGLSFDFRNAFEKSLNQTELSKVYGNILTPSTSLIPNVILNGKTALKSQITTSYLPAYSKEEAHNLYLAGLKNSGGISAFTILYFGDSNVAELTRKVAENLQETLGAVVNIKSTESLSELNSAVESGEYQMAVVPLTAGNSDAKNFLSKFLSNGSENIYGFKSEEYDRYIEQITPYSSEDEVKENTQKALQILKDAHFIIPLAGMNEAFGYSVQYTCPTVSPFNGVIDLALVEKAKD